MYPLNFSDYGVAPQLALPTFPPLEFPAGDLSTNSGSTVAGQSRQLDQTNIPPPVFLAGDLSTNPVSTGTGQARQSTQPDWTNIPPLPETGQPVTGSESYRLEEFIDPSFLTDETDPTFSYNGFNTTNNSTQPEPIENLTSEFASWDTGLPAPRPLSEEDMMALFGCRNPNEIIDPRLLMQDTVFGWSVFALNNVFSYF
jgi:hypothetical protein